MTDFVQNVVADQFDVKTGDGVTINDSIKAKFAVDWKLVEKGDYDALEVTVLANSASIIVNEDAITANGVLIAANTSDISDNAANITVNSNAISSKGNFFTGTTALAAIQSIGLTDGSFTAKTWPECAVLIKNAMIAIGGGVICFGFDSVSTVPSLASAITAAGGVISGLSTFEAMTSISVTGYPVLITRINNENNDIYTSNIAPYTSGAGTHIFKKISMGEDVDEDDCTSLATFSTFNVKAVKTGGVTHIYGLFVLSVHPVGNLFSVPSKYGVPSISVGQVSMISSTKFLAFSTAASGDTYSVDYSSVDSTGVPCYVNITYKS